MPTYVHNLSSSMFVTNGMCISDVCHHEILGFVGFQPETYFVSEDFHPWKCTSSSYGLTSISEKDLSLTPKNHGTFYFQDDKEFLTCVGHIYGFKNSTHYEKGSTKSLMDWVSRSEYSDMSGSLSTLASSFYLNAFRILIQDTMSSVPVHVIVDIKCTIEDIWFDYHGGKKSYIGKVPSTDSCIDITGLPALIQENKTSVFIEIVNVQILKVGVTDCDFYTQLILSSVQAAISERFVFFNSSMKTDGSGETRSTITSIDTRFQPIGQQIILGRNAAGMVKTVSKQVGRILNDKYDFKYQSKVFDNDMGGYLTIKSECFDIYFVVLNGLGQGFRLDVSL